MASGAGERRVSLERLGPWVLAAAALLLALSYGACTQDDAFISFRYAENLLRGHGLVYNPGERVEGYTDLLWTLLVAGGMALGADPVRLTLALGLLSLGGLVLASAALARRLGSRGAWSLLAPALLAADAALALEAVEGLETAFYALLLLAGTLVALREPGSLRARLGSGALYGLAALTRPEAPWLWAWLQLGLLLEGEGSWRERLRLAALGSGPLLAVVAAHESWRLLYYGDPLPNTFYAKTGGGLRAVPRGFAYLAFHLRGHPLLWGLGLAGLGLRRPGRAVLASLLAGQLLYVLAVGGDFKPTGRFLIPVLPYLAVLAGRGAEALAAVLPARARWPLGLGLLAAGLYSARSLYALQDRVAEDRHANLEARKLVGDYLAAHFPPDTLLAIHSAGEIPYYAGLPTIDMWGLTDRHIARSRPPGLGTGLPGHEKGDPAYVFSRNPDLYLPEDRVFTLRPWELEPEPGFPPDFAERYRSLSLPVAGRWLNLWARRGFLEELRARSGRRAAPTPGGGSGLEGMEPSPGEAP